MVPTPEDLAEEERRLRQLRLVVNLALSVIAQTDLSRNQAEALVVATRGAALGLFPGKEEAFDLIYLPRFQRLLAERWPPSRSGAEYN
jgi:hypothetical protein